jgi:hypothetical protein
MPEPLKGHVEVNAEKHANFQDLVRLITKHRAGKRAFLPSGLPSTSSSAMDVDALLKGKRNEPKGKGAGKSFDGKGYGNNCYEQKGTAQGKGSGKTYDQKGAYDQKGKGEQKGNVL